MKKILILSIVMASLSYSKIITIIDNGVERKIDIKVDTSKVKARAVNSASVGIIIAFKDKNIDLNEFTSKYNLKLKKSLKVGYYIFENHSNVSDIEQIANISNKDRKIIKTIRPNWALGMQAR